jgi:hypothetical protein
VEEKQSTVLEVVPRVAKGIVEKKLEIFLKLYAVWPGGSEEFQDGSDSAISIARSVVDRGGLLPKLLPHICLIEVKRSL